MFQDGPVNIFKSTSWYCKSKGYSNIQSSVIALAVVKVDPSLLYQRFNPCWPAPSTYTSQQVARISLGAHPNVNRFPLNNFKHFLTLFSKFFSSFPHGTCLLSVSCQYLALEGIYLQVRAAFSNNPTRWKHLVMQSGNSLWGFHPLWHRLPADSSYTIHRGWFFRLQFSERRFTSWAFPRSLAVTRGILVSFFSSAYWYA